MKIPNCVRKRDHKTGFLVKKENAGFIREYQMYNNKKIRLREKEKERKKEEMEEGKRETRACLCKKFSVVSQLTYIRNCSPLFTVHGTANVKQVSNWQ